MGHIELAAPVSHIWYFKGIPSRMGLLLDMSPRALEKYCILRPMSLSTRDRPLFPKTNIVGKRYRDSLEKFGPKFRAGMGAEAVRELLQEINLTSFPLSLGKKSTVHGTKESKGN